MARWQTVQTGTKRIGVAMLAIWFGLASAETVFESGPRQVQLVELYTSEGCSSCPPAERFLSTLKDDDRLWHELVPVALHVDYWDYIGWRDSFADADHSQRQRSHRKFGNLSQVYTPGFVVDGAEWRAYFRGQRLPNRPELQPGNLRLIATDDSISVDFDRHAGSDEELTVRIALLGSGVESDVLRGENAGRSFSHDFIALRHDSAPLGEGGSARFDVLRSDHDAEQFALVAWVEDRSQRAIQAVGGWLQ